MSPLRPRTQAAIVAAFVSAFALGLLFSAAAARAQHGHPELMAALLAVTILTGLALSFLFWLIVGRPLARLGERARNWRLGQPWSCDVHAACPEMRDLLNRMQDLTGRLNEQYRIAKDLVAMKSRLIAVVSHELNNAISVIQVAADALEYADRIGPADREKMLGVIKAQSRTVALTVSNLLSLGRLESGRFAVARKRLDLPDLLRSCALLMDVLCKKKRLRLSLALPAEAPPVWADGNALTLVMTNLLSNAIKYTPEGGAIWLGLRREATKPGSVTVYVRDTGIGISERDRERIFSANFRCENGKAMAGGFGLGLALARSILKSHDAAIEVESAPGRGSTFSFRLPVWRPGLEAEAPRERAAA
ncbi:MAG: HAMP domain-containing sensor histidine kinase [Elusimicrobia bacterium]|nr:HAMP domain-containing sensor histidine kinase [Elusimicrobiota bacterium]